VFKIKRPCSLQCAYSHLIRITVVTLQTRVLLSRLGIIWHWWKGGDALQLGRYPHRSGVALAMPHRLTVYTAIRGHGVRNLGDKHAAYSLPSGVAQCLFWCRTDVGFVHDSPRMRPWWLRWHRLKVKDKVFLYSLPSVGPRADPGVQAVSPQVTWSESRHRPGSRLPLLSARPAFTFVAFTRWRYL